MNSRLDTIQAAILLVKMDALEKYELADVNAAAAMYNEALAGIPGDPAGRSGGLVFELGAVYAPAAQPGGARPRAIGA